MRTPVPRGTLALASLAAGVVVGFADGLSAGLGAQADLRGVILAGCLAAAVVGLWGGAAGALLEVLARAALWGRQVRPPRWALILAVVVAGVLVAGLAVAVAVVTIDRRARFLAGGVSSLAATGGGIVAAALLPALARLLGRSSVQRPSSPAVDSALLCLAPLVLGVLGTVILVGAMGVRAPASSVRALRSLAVVGIHAGLLPVFLTWAERLPVRTKRLPSVALAAAVFGGLALAGVMQTWSNHLRFVPWTHVVPSFVTLLLALAIMRVAGGCAPRWLPSRFRVALLGGGSALLLLVLVPLTSRSETARKVTVSRAALVGPALAGLRPLLDWDGDSYPRWLGGGDCDDGDPTVHPGVLDLPDDGLDQDCDGRDASTSVLLAPPFVPVADSVPRDLNLLLVTIDTVRADHLGCYGYPRATSPELDRLAAAGALFENGWAHAPSTRYSMPAIATGRWPTTIAWDESIWWPRIAPGVRTLAEALQAEGYFTAAFYSFDYFSPADRRGFERGVDLYRADRAVLHRAVNGPMESRGSSSREIADDTIAFLETHGRRQFFLWAHFYDPHLSYEPHTEVPSFGQSRVDLYDGEIRFVDLHFGRVVARLRELGLWDKTAIVVTGDHGEGFGEHGVSEHGFDLYAAQTKVPFIVRVPGLAPRRLTTPAGHVDIAPTLLNLARGRQDPGFQGRSLVDLLTGPPPSPPLSPPSVVFQEVSSERGKKRALVTEDWHLIWNWTPENTTECYHRRTDPDERRDLWGRSHDGVCGRLKAELQGMVSALALPPDAARKMNAGVFPPGRAAPRPAVPVGATIGDAVNVVGYSLAPAAAVAAGGTIDLDILFESRKVVRDGWRFFFHLLGPAGSYRNLDHVPVEGLMPVERWRPGQRVLDKMRIPLPAGTPPGDYQLVMGLFQGGQRLPVTPAALSDGKQALRLATITVR